MQKSPLTHKYPSASKKASSLASPTTPLSVYSSPAVAMSNNNNFTNTNTPTGQILKYEQDRAMSNPDTSRKLKDTLRSRADLSKAMETLGLNVTETARYSLVSGGGDFQEKEELIKIKKHRKEKEQQDHASEGNDELKKAQRRKATARGVKRRLVYWMDSQNELVFNDITDGSCLSHIMLQRTDVISGQRIGIARYFASTDNVHTSKFVELMLVELIGQSDQQRTIRQIAFPFAPGRKYITIYIGGDKRYFKGLPDNALPATLSDNLSVNAFGAQLKEAKRAKRPSVSRKRRGTAASEKSDFSSSSSSQINDQYSSDSQNSYNSFESYDDTFSSQVTDRFRQFSFNQQPHPRTTSYIPNFSNPVSQNNSQLQTQLPFKNSSPIVEEAVFQQIASIDFGQSRPIVLSQNPYMQALNENENEAYDSTNPDYVDNSEMVLDGAFDQSQFLDFPPDVFGDDQAKLLFIQQQQIELKHQQIQLEIMQMNFLNQQKMARLYGNGTENGNEMFPTTTMNNFSGSFQEDQPQPVFQNQENSFAISNFLQSPGVDQIDETMG